MLVPRIWVDINEWDPSRRSVPIPAVSVPALERHGVPLREGLALHLYSDDLDDEGRRDDLLADGRAHFDAETKQWLAVELGPIRNVSELSAAARGEQIYLQAS